MTNHELLYFLFGVSASALFNTFFGLLGKALPKNTVVLAMYASIGLVYMAFAILFPIAYLISRLF